MANLTEKQSKELTRRVLAGESPTKLADEFSVSRTTVYRHKREGQTDEFASSAGANLYGEFGVTGLKRFGGMVQDDYLPNWRDLSNLVKIVQEMVDDPIIGATLFAAEMSMRGADWSVVPGGEMPADKKAAEFLESCKEDMSHSWDDHITQALSMLPFGFSPFEIVYKKRQGPFADPLSNFDDGLIGWRKFGFRSQDSLSPGNEWDFDKNGGIAAMNQLAAPNYQPRKIPIEKMILYRTTAAKNNPQGKSALRSAYIPWYYAKQFMELEGIAAERMGGGLPVMYLGEGTSKDSSNSTSDYAYAKQVVRDVRNDSQAGLVIPHRKMGNDGKGILLELLSPASNNLVDYDKAIERYNQQKAQTVLAQFIFLGLTERGTQALAGELVDFFADAVTGWLTTLAETLNSFAVPRLFRLNAPSFTGISSLPAFDVASVRRPDVEKILTAISDAVGADILHPVEGDERKVRQLLDLPQLGTDEAGQPLAGKPLVPSDVPPQNAGPEPSLAKARAKAERFSLKSYFALRTDGKPGRPQTWEENTNRFQKDLAALYVAWSQDLAVQLEDAFDYSEQQAVIDAAVQNLQSQMKVLTNRAIRQGVTIGMGGLDLTAAAQNTISFNQRQYQGYIDGGLASDMRQRLYDIITNPGVMALGATGIFSALSKVQARVESYSGAMWGGINAGVGETARLMNAADLSPTIYWQRDPRAEHCNDCLEFGEQEYGSWDEMLSITGGVYPGGGTECDGNCRCQLLINTPDSGGNQRTSGLDLSAIPENLL